MTNDMLPYCLGFSHFLGIGPVRFQALVNAFGSPKKAYEASKDNLVNILGAKTGDRFDCFRRVFDPIKKLEEIKRKEISIVCFGDSSYPVLLKNIPDPPICLYVKGKPEAVNFEKKYFIAIVGTRRPTVYGQQIARMFAAELSRLGFVVVSGMAIGIDTIIHQSVLNNNGQTIAILGCGVDIIYPAINSYLYYSIIKNNGLVISEFPPGETVKPGLFIARNRIISGLCRGAVVVEGQKDSGAMITARYAVNQGREVFATPGPINSIMSEAPNILLKNGAKLVTSINDILEELNIVASPLPEEEKTISLTDEEKKVIFLLKNKPMLVDELTVKLGYPIEKIANSLSLLEIKGAVEKNEEGKYQIKLSHFASPNSAGYVRDN